MAQTLVVYIGRDNVEGYDLLVDGELVTINTITAAHFMFSNHSIDTASDPTLIELTEDETRVEITAGQISGLTVGVYPGRLTCYDPVATDGIAWQDFNVQVVSWAVPSDGTPSGSPSSSPSAS